MSSYIGKKAKGNRLALKHRYILFNKPYDVLSKFTDASGRRTLSAFVPVADVYPVGRLDRDSEGLLLLTSDGRLQHRLSHPKFDHAKTYWVQVERVPGEPAIEKLRRGLLIQDYRTRPAAVRPIDSPQVPPRDPPIRSRKTVPTAWLEVVLTEGRNRQVRRMTAAVGFPTLRLIRVAIAHLEIGALAPGDWRDLTPGEIGELQKLSQRDWRHQTLARRGLGPHSADSRRKKSHRLS
ncbi:MAG: pseudouridine synthase [Elainellaceae cyanobacterium]